MPVFLIYLENWGTNYRTEQRVFEMFFKATFNYVIDLIKNLNQFIALYIFRKNNVKTVSWQVKEKKKLVNFSIPMPRN